MRIGKTIKIMAGIIIATTILSGIIYYQVASNTFVRGKYGTKCYKTFNAHRNIKYHIYFKTLKECLDSIE